MTKRIRSSPSRHSKLLKSKDASTKRSPEQLSPIFSLEHLQASHCVSEIVDRSERGLFMDALFTLSRMSWSQINSAPRHGLGTERMPARQIKAKIPSCVTADVNLLVFRWKGKLPFVGFRDGRVLNILWIEQQFGDLYDHG
ncbi:hypothetical protein [Pseudomonas sp. MYb118]|uniref:hypothetical protein n=1 Tax=Pseudomonas sp. MYb118 TaxID=1848720 RepID=UPI0034CD0FDC